MYNIQTLIIVSISAIATLMDFYELKIKNWLLLTGLLLGLSTAVSKGDMNSIILSVVGSVIPIICLWMYFNLKILGAGDVKLFAVIGSFIGPIKIVYCIATSIIIAGIIGIIVLFVKKNEAGYHKIRFALPVLLSVLLYGGGLY